VKDAASQLEFLKEVGSAGVGSLQAPDLLYLQGLLAWKQGRDLSQVAAHTSALHCCVHELQSLHCLQPDAKPPWETERDLLTLHSHLQNSCIASDCKLLLESWLDVWQCNHGWHTPQGD